MTHSVTIEALRMSASELQFWMAWDLDGGIVVRVDPGGVSVELICAATQRRVSCHRDLRAYLAETATEGQVPLRQTVANRLPADHSTDVERAVRLRVARAACTEPANDADPDTTRSGAACGSDPTHRDGTPALRPGAEHHGSTTIDAA